MELQLERKKEAFISAPPEFRYNDIWKYVDDTKLEKENIPTFQPDDWIPPARKGDKPEFSQVNNPGGWSEYVYCPYFPDNGKEYAYHQLPSGCTPVPNTYEDKSGKTILQPGPIRKIKGDDGKY